MNLEIVSPGKIIYNGKAESVTLPGFSGSFSILDRHAPIVAALKNGILSYSVDGEDKEVMINGGFVEVKKNIISICVE